MLNLLPVNLRNNILMESNEIFKISFLAENFNQETLENARLLCEEHIFMPGQTIIEKLSIDDSLYFILKGQVIICFHKTAETSYDEKGKGETLNEIEFINGIKIELQFLQRN